LSREANTGKLEGLNKYKEKFNCYEGEKVWWKDWKLRKKYP